VPEGGTEPKMTVVTDATAPIPCTAPKQSIISGRVRSLRMKLGTHSLDGLTPFWICSFQGNDLFGRKPFRINLHVSLWVSVISQVEERIETEVIPRFLSAKAANFFLFMKIGTKGHGFELYWHTVFEKKSESPTKGGEGSWFASNLLIGFPSYTVNRNFHISWWILLEKLYMGSGDQ
jgi:hypothetical protein